MVGQIEMDQGTILCTHCYQKYIYCFHYKTILLTSILFAVKNKIAYRRQALISMQKTVRGYLVRKRHGPRIIALRNIRELNGNLKKIEASAAQLKKDRDIVGKDIEKLKTLFISAIDRIKVNVNH